MCVSVPVILFPVGFIIPNLPTGDNFERRRGLSQSLQQPLPLALAKTGFFSSVRRRWFGLREVTCVQQEDLHGPAAKTGVNTLLIVSELVVSAIFCEYFANDLFVFDVPIGIIAAKIVVIPGAPNRSCFSHRC